jgi:argininosuccinate synthase
LIVSWVQIIAPWRVKEFTERFQGRQDLLEYAATNNIPVSATPKAPWSMDANLMHISYESGILENPNNEAPHDLFLMTVDPKKAPNEPFKLSIEFAKGLPIKVITQDAEVYDSPLEIFTFLNKIGGKYGVGRIDIVENRFIGLKSRGVYETPGGYILHVAHTDLEVFCLDKEVYRVKQSLRDRLSDYVYNGFWFSPEGRYVSRCVALAEENVTGKVNMEIYKGNVTVLGRWSPVSLYNEDLVSMDKHSDFTPSDATGFINIQAIRLKEYNRFRKQQNM